tara:strand:- start:301 stop:798 length:498 start_codon:yes stop_codon:yes gene_type:complete
LKIKTLLFLVIFNVNLYALNVADQLNNFFQSELVFVHKSLNKKNNNIEESKGFFERNIDHTRIEILTPYSETYNIYDYEIEIIDLEFSQKRYISIKDLENNFFLDLILNGINDDYDDITVIEDGKYILIKDNLEIAINFINKDTLQLKYKDNLGIDNLIRFSRNS